MRKIDLRECILHDGRARQCCLGMGRRKRHEVGGMRWRLKCGWADEAGAWLKPLGALPITTFRAASSSCTQSFCMTMSTALSHRIWEEQQLDGVIAAGAIVSVGLYGRLLCTVHTVG